MEQQNSIQLDLFRSICLIFCLILLTNLYGTVHRSIRSFSSTSCISHSMPVQENALGFIWVYSPSSVHCYLKCDEIILSLKQPSECNTYADIDAVYKCLKEQYGVKDEQLILYGQSVGSGPTVDLASRVPHLRGVVLHSPILSGVRVLYPVKRTYWFDIYKNVDKIGAVNCPVLVIHGTTDEVVDCSHGKQLWELSKEKYEPLWINGGGHCNLELYPEYIKHLKKFVMGLGKPKPATNGTQKASIESDNQNKPAENGATDTLDVKPDLPEVSRNSLDSRLEKTKKSNKPEKSRMSTDRVDRFRRRKGLVW